MPPHDLLALDALRYFLDSEGPDASPHQTGSLIVRRLAVVSVISLLAISGCSREVPVNSEPSLSSNEVSTTPATPAATQAVEPSESDESESSSPTPSLSPTSTPEPTPSETTPAALLSPGDSSDEVRALQHRLLQVGWFTGQISGEYDDKTKAAVEGFQAKRGLPVLGFVDQATMDSLASMTREPTHDEMFNVLKPGPALMSKGATGDQVKDLQARLKQIGWFNPDVDGEYGETTMEAVKGFQGKRQLPVTGEVDQRTLDRISAMTRKPTQDELNNVKPSVNPADDETGLDARCLQGRVLCVSKAQRKLVWVIDGQVQMTVDVRFGSELTPTRNGVFSVGWKSRDHVSTMYHTPMPYAMFFSGGQAIHYSADFASNGYNGASHGCVNVRDKGAIASLFDQVRVGDKVVVYTD